VESNRIGEKRKIGKLKEKIKINKVNHKISNYNGKKEENREKERNEETNTMNEKWERKKKGRNKYGM